MSPPPFSIVEPPRSYLQVVMDDDVADLIRDRAVKDEETLREMLGRWASETEPTIIRGPNREILGLAGPNGAIVVEVQS